MALVLDLAYLLAAVVASPWLIYRLLVIGDRTELPSRLGFGLGARLEGSLWLHGSSVGEVSLLRPLIQRFERDLPGVPLLISTFSTTGLATARKAYPQHRVVLLPFDLSFVVRRFLRHFDPRLIVIVESEFWPNLLLAARRRRIPLAVINGKISSKSFRFHARTLLIPKLLRHLPLIAVQTREHAVSLERLGVPAGSIRVTGNMKYDLARPPGSPERADDLRRALGYRPEDTIIIGGSLHEREDQVLLDAFAMLERQRLASRLIIVPRYPGDTSRVAQAIEQHGYQAVRKTSIDAGRSPPPGRDGVLLVDTVGELRDVYAAADIAFVGGSLFYRGSNKGGHNLMEPAILGLPVLFGPYNFSFKETVDALLAAGAGALVRDAAGMAGTLAEWLRDPSKRREVGQRARRVVLDGQGATDRNYGLLLSLLDAGGGRLPVVPEDFTMPRAAGELDS